MTVHHVINDYNLESGGAQRIAYELHRTSINAGLSSRLIGLSKKTYYDIDGAYCLSFKQPYNPLVLVKLWQYFREEVVGNDIVHVHLFPASFYISFLRIFNLIPKCKLVFTEHSTTNRRRGTFLGSIIDKLTYFSFTRIVAISPGTLQGILQCYPHLVGKLMTINNGVNLYYKNYTARDKKKRVIVLSVGRLHESKNYTTAIGALELIKHLNFEYWIAGSGDLELELKAQVLAAGLQDRVKFLGYVGNVIECLSKADIFLLPSRWEGFGLAAVEAMNAGLPAVLSNVPGMRDVIETDGEEAFLVAPDNIHQISSKLALLIEDCDLRIEMGSKAFRHAKNFDVKKMHIDYLNLYESLRFEK